MFNYYFLLVKYKTLHVQAISTKFLNDKIWASAC